ncbi:META domain-containing protein [Acinetobacter sp. 1000160]|uniref:META domain-containing protein n=1 Tax=Acinetobacter sp. 1000160 TaxID=1310800 RepID=UPI00044BE135|nr:META domain-containing protein [Acinetobacter sp. 1000160]EXB45974.1 META domain protein [Acinetobacter baumannii 146457]EYT18746.1 META domain protein [Acinetobacter sp. 1000160]
MLKPFLTTCTLAIAVAMTGCAATESLQTSPNASQKESIGLYNRNWIATHINGVEIKSNDLSGKRPAIQFDAQGKRFFGADGCNQIQGTFESQGSILRLGPIASTMMACIGKDNSALSRQYANALASTTNYELKGHELKFRDASGKVLVSFVTVIQPLP